MNIEKTKLKWRLEPIDAVADCAHRDAFVYTKRKLFIASATPKPLGAPNCCECGSLLCVAHVSSGESRGIPRGGPRVLHYLPVCPSRPYLCSLRPVHFGGPSPTTSQESLFLCQCIFQCPYSAHSSAYSSAHICFF